MATENSREHDERMPLTDVHETALRDRAIAASRQSYCPYSHFPVGAAVLIADGSLFSGCNVENASFGLTLCAERNAVFHAVAAGCREIIAVAVYTPTKQPVPPCGACRQVICEFGPNADILVFSESGSPVRLPMSRLLPDAFGSGNMKTT